MEREGESEEDNSGSSPTLSDLPAYEGRDTASSEGAPGAGKQVLDSEGDAVEDEREENKRTAELEEVRRRVNEESRRVVEEDSRTGKERLMAKREEEQKESRRREAARREVELGKRVEAREAERERVDSPPPPLSPASYNMLPLGNTKDRHTSTILPSSSRQVFSHPSAQIPPRFQHSTLPSPSPMTTYSTPIPSTSSGAIHSLRARPSRDFSSESLAPFPPSEPTQSRSLPYDATGSLRGATGPRFDSKNERFSNDRQGSIGPASSFYSAAVGITVSLISLVSSLVVSLSAVEPYRSIS